MYSFPPNLMAQGFVAFPVNVMLLLELSGRHSIGLGREREETGNRCSRSKPKRFASLSTEGRVTFFEMNLAY